MHAALDLPAPDSLCDPLNLRIQGWFSVGDHQAEIAAFEAWAGDTLIGSTALVYPRSDVSAALGLSPDARTGFTLSGYAPDSVPCTSLALSIAVRWADGRRETALTREIKLSGRDYRQGAWGVLVDREFPHLVRRAQMYNSGPSQAEGSLETLALLRRYLPPPPTRVLDVGCGLGFYGRHLRADGYDWFGVEMKAEDCSALAQQGLPHRQIDGERLPFADGEFDTAICVEVLEHTENPWHFMAEVRRAIRRRLLVSVPNLELVPYWHSHLAVPWHLLERDHRNFFSRASLRELLRPHFREIEVMGYGEAPLRSAEGAALDYHLFAIATV